LFNSEQQLDKLQRILSWSHIWRQTRRPRHSPAARQPALASHQRANNIQVLSAGVQGHTWSGSHHPTCASRSPPCQYDDRSWCQGRESSSVNQAFAVAGREAWNVQSSETVTAFKESPEVMSV